LAGRGPLFPELREVEIAERVDAIAEFARA
jgi:hypothetical protein